MAVCALLLSAGAIAIAVTVTTHNPDPTTRWVFIGAAGVFTAGMGLLCLSTANYRLTLLSDRMESHGLFRQRTLTRSAIEGLRIKPSGTVRLQARPGAGQGLEISRYLFADPALGPWLEGLENLDDRDRAMEAGLLAADARLGLSQPDRDASLRALRGWKWAADVFGLGTGAWLMIGPHPYWLAVALGAAVPAIVMALTVAWKDLVIVMAQDDTAAIDLTTLWMMPTMGLGIRMMLDFDPAGPGTGGFPAGAILGLAAWLLMLWANRAARQPWVAAVAAVLLLVWSYASLCAIDAGLDGHPPVRVAARVIDYRVDNRHPHRASMTLQTLEPSPRTFRNVSVHVAQVGSDPYPPGSVIPLEIGEGFFGWRYIDMRQFRPA